MPARTGTFSAELKPRQGKLLRCTLTLEQGVISHIRFTGDFFLMPGTAIAELERHLIERQPGETAEAINAFFSHADVEMLGVTPEHFIAVVETALARS
ncbi:MAG: lipoate protein ligase C-terminal domain-containing protein [Thermoplasmatota archaeon]